MIVMKFGGSSLESGQAIRRATSIVKSQVALEPVVVVSALGNTTDGLLESAREAERGHSYLAWKGLKKLWEFHSDTAAAVTSGESQRWLEDSLHKHFQQLHRTIVKMEDEGGQLTPALLDEIASYGERLSSEVMAAALHCAGVPSVQLDSRQLILTDDHFTHATPLYWETYAKLRRVIPRMAGSRTVVMGGFIGSTESGATTTLGRGGSDLTATLVGAGLAADEIQIWKDVDGILTCSPKLFAGAHRLKSISYQEAATLARAGAEVLHPETVTPAVRQRIPIVIRNSQRPEVEGTRIVPAVTPCRNLFKSIAAKENLTVLEVRLAGNAASLPEDLTQVCGRHGVTPQLIARSGDVVYLGVKRSDRYDRLRLDIDGCVEVRMHAARAVVTLVGAAGQASELVARVREILKSSEVFAIGEHDLAAMVPQSELRRSVEALHREFFTQVDPESFAKVESRAAGRVDVGQREVAEVRSGTLRRPRVVLVQN